MKARFAQFLAAAAMIAGVAVAAAPASAQTDWQRHHPARAEINHRIAHQERMIRHERRDGEITRDQAHAMRAEDHAIRHEERADARADHNHGHLDHAQVRHLRHELNAAHGAMR